MSIVFAFVTVYRLPFKNNLLLLDSTCLILKVDMLWQLFHNRHLNKHPYIVPHVFLDSILSAMIGIPSRLANLVSKVRLQYLRSSGN